MRPDQGPGGGTGNTSAGRTAAGGAPGTRPGTRRHRHGEPLPWIIRAVFAAGIFLAVTALIGLLLNLTTGLTTTGWLIAAGLLGAAAALRLSTRHARRAAEGHADRREDDAGGTGAGHAGRRPSVLAAQPGEGWDGSGLGHALVRARVSRSSLRTTGFALLAAALAGGAVGLTAASAGWQRTPGFAQLWLVPAAGGATLGVRSDYPGTQTFHLELRRGNGTTQKWTLSLASGQSWQRAVAVANGTRLAARLAAPDRILTVEATS